MPIELEIKLKLDDHEPVRARLREIGAKRLGEVLETNTFFDTPDRTLKSQDRGLRLRTSTLAATGAAKHIITYKGPRAPGAIKRREEIEFAIDQPDRAVALFKGLGYTDTFTFEKRRESWPVDDCLVELDELPHLGKFIEIEGPSEASILAVRATLQLDDAPAIAEPYIALLSRYLKTQKLPLHSVRF
jgi:adenylate cyclase class 2